MIMALNQFFTYLLTSTFVHALSDHVTTAEKWVSAAGHTQCSPYFTIMQIPIRKNPNLLSTFRTTAVVVTGWLSASYPAAVLPS